MTIGYSEETLRSNIYKQAQDIESEILWLKVYYQAKDVDCIEDCARNIMQSCEAILENIENLKEEKL